MKESGNYHLTESGTLEAEAGRSVHGEFQDSNGSVERDTVSKQTKETNITHNGTERHHVILRNIQLHSVIFLSKVV